MRHGHPEPISEVIWCYGRYNMAIAPGKQEHEIGDVFATLMPGSEAFYEKSGFSRMGRCRSGAPGRSADGAISGLHDGGDQRAGPPARRSGA
jgi:hypothetical protein